MHLELDFLLHCIEHWSTLQGNLLGMQVLTDIQKLYLYKSKFILNAPERRRRNSEYLQEK